MKFEIGMTVLIFDNTGHFDTFTLTQVQNDQLKALNATLEKRVASRTDELQQTADMLDLAYEELKRSYVTGTEGYPDLVMNGGLTTLLVFELARTHASTPIRHRKRSACR